MSRSAENPIAKRRVFYIPGYDPFPPRRYRELYRTEAAEQAKISGYSIELSAKHGGVDFGWYVTAVVNGCRVETDVDVLVWSDIVRASMGASVGATYMQLAKTAWVYVSTGALFQLMKLRKGPVVAALYPVVILVLQLQIALLLGWISYLLVMFCLGSMTSVQYVNDYPLVQIAALISSFAMGYHVLKAFRAVDYKVFAYYLMHDFAFSAKLKGANSPELDVRLREFALKISDACEEDYDEVLVVGHSSGVHLAVSVLAQVRQQIGASKLAFLSLGHVVPMVSFLPNAKDLRRDLNYLSQQENIAWIDVTAPGDGCSFALCDPVAVSSVAPQSKAWPLVFSAAFSQSLSAQKWRRLKRRYFRIHFQYLCAFDQPKDYDYFQITAGPLSLKDRYRGRAASKSRSETPINRHTSMSK